VYARASLRNTRVYARASLKSHGRMVSQLFPPRVLAISDEVIE
jgi:hypothetical protein